MKALGLTLFLSLLTLHSCDLIRWGDNDHLRGKSEPSEDGKTYLIVGDDTGAPCEQILLNDKLWPHAVGERGRVKPGTHKLTCGIDYEFVIPPKVVFRFDYWGP